MTEATARHVGPYRLDQLLGQGGMGAVYRAWDERLERWVAIKQIRPDSAENERARERFRREARASARLNHPSIVQIFDILESEDGDWIVMELVEGRTLAELLTEERPDLRRVLELAREIGWALAEAHRKGIVHRDLKAENVLVTPEGHAKILDFGLAKLVAPQSHEATLTIPGGPMGTARAMSPEQARGLEIDARSDLFSFGVLLYEAIAGISPFQGQTVFDTLVKVATFEPPPLSQTLPELPGELVGLVVSLLQKDRAQRPQGIGEVLEVLERLLGNVDESRLAALRRLTVIPRRGSAISTDLIAAETLLDSETTAGQVPVAQVQRPSTLASPPAEVARRGLSARHLVTALVLLGVAAGGLFWALRPPSPLPSLYVAVLQPEVSGGDGIAGAELLATGLRVALINTLASIEGLSPLAPEILDPVQGSPIDVARASGASEVVTAQLSCQVESCIARMARLRGADGTVLWNDTFQFPLEDFHTLGSAGAIKLRSGYGDLKTREGAPTLDVSGDTFRAFSAVLTDYRKRQAPVPELLERLAAIEAEAPTFIEAPLLASEILRRNFSDASWDRSQLLLAIEAGRRAIRIAPGDARARHRLFDALVEAKELTEAEEVLKEMEKSEMGQPETLVCRARLLERQGRPQEALFHLKAAASQQRSWKLLFRLANFEMNQGLAAEARGHLEETLQLLPGHYDSLSLLAQLEMVHGNGERAVELYEQLVEQSPGVIELGNLGVAQALLGRWSAARVTFSKAVALEPRNPLLLLNLADSEEVDGRREEARAHYRMVLELMPDGPQLTWQELSARAQAYAHLGQVTDAVASIQRALQASSGSPLAHFEAALVYALVGEKTSALVNAEVALEGGVDRRFFSLPWFDEIRPSLPGETVAH